MRTTEEASPVVTCVLPGVAEGAGRPAGAPARPGGSQALSPWTHSPSPGAKSQGHLLTQRRDRKEEGHCSLWPESRRPPWHPPGVSGRLMKTGPDSRRGDTAAQRASAT